MNAIKFNVWGILKVANQKEIEQEIGDLTLNSS